MSNFSRTLDKKKGRTLAPSSPPPSEPALSQEPKVEGTPPPPKPES